MKLNTTLLSIIASGATATSATAATVIGSTSDSIIRENSVVDWGSHSVISAGSYYGQSVVAAYAFQMPVLSVGESFDSATVSFNFANKYNNDGFAGLDFNVNVIGIRSDSSDAISGDDYSAAGTLLQSGFTTPTTAFGMLESVDISSWLNTLNSGEYAIIKLESATATSSGQYAFTTANSSTNKPILEYTTAVVPEPSSTALLGLGGLALILRRRK